jgi:phytoene dehydrogenase-like protein
MPMPPNSDVLQVAGVVLGAGHNGLVPAATLADGGWDSLVVEAWATSGGRRYEVRS